MMDNLVCPYPDHPGYIAVRNTLTLDEQKIMAETIHITHDQKIKILPLYKEFDLFRAEHNDRDTFSGSYRDCYDQSGISRITYLSREGAKREADLQQKGILLDSKAVENLFSFLPGDEDTKAYNLLLLLQLPEYGAGILILSDKDWFEVGKSGCLALSQVNEFGGNQTLERNPAHRFEIGSEIEAYVTDGFSVNDMALPRLVYTTI